MLPISSYHDIYVEIDGERVQFSSLPFNMILQLTRSGGWELWRTNECAKDEVVSGEFHTKNHGADLIPFRLWFGDELVFDSTSGG